MRLGVKILPAVVLAVCVVWPARPCRGGGIEAITRPSEDRTLAFSRPGRIEKVHVKPGDDVKQDQALIQLDDAAERVQLERLGAEAEDTTRVEAAKAQLAQKKVDLANIEWAGERGAATELEVQHARLDVKIAELSLKLAKFNQVQARREYDQAKLQVDRMSLTSPIAGRVEQVVVEAGEAADAVQNLIRVVKIDPLWVEVPVPLTVVGESGLAVGSAADVRFDAPGGASGGGTTVRGKVIYVAAVADAASNTRTVRVEVPNKALRPAGEHVQVTFPKPPQVASSDSKAPAVGASKTALNEKE